jgi:CheY-like chemotaxis protein
VYGNWFYFAHCCLRWALGNSPTGMPIIAMTARAMKGDRKVAWLQLAGMDDYISKPVHRKELNEVIVRNLVQKPELAPVTAIHVRAASSRD